MYSIRMFITVLILTSPSLLINCETAQKNYSEEMIDGVRYVHNIKLLYEDVNKFDLQFVQKIGKLESRDENYLLYRINGVAVDKDGNIYILDSGNYRIQKFTSDGKYLATYGGSKGQGPGEFMSANSMTIDNEENLYVGDMNRYTIIVIDKNLKLIKEIKFKKPLYVTNFVISPRKNIAYNITETLNKNYAEVPLFTIYDNELNEIKGVGTRKIFAPDIYTFTFNEIKLTNDVNGNYYINFVYQNRIEKYNNDGDLVLRIDRELPFKEITNIILHKKMNNKGRERYYTDAPIFGFGLGVDHKGRIWVKSSVRQKTNDEKINGYDTEGNDLYAFEIYSPEGILLHRKQYPFLQNGNIKFNIIGDRIFMQKYPEPVLYEYQIIDK